MCDIMTTNLLEIYEQISSRIKECVELAISLDKDIPNRAKSYPYDTVIEDYDVIVKWDYPACGRGCCGYENHSLYLSVYDILDDDYIEKLRTNYDAKEKQKLSKLQEQAKKAEEERLQEQIKQTEREKVLLKELLTKHPDILRIT